jgi:hypothetical protein
LTNDFYAIRSYVTDHPDTYRAAHMREETAAVVGELPLPVVLDQRIPRGSVYLLRTSK